MKKEKDEDQFIQRDQIVGEKEQKHSSDRDFIDYTQVDKEKMPVPDQSIDVEKQEDSSKDTTTIKE